MVLLVRIYVNCWSKGFKVVAFDRYNINNDLGWLKKSKFRKDIEFILGDIRDFESVNSALKNCNYVFHLAALIEFLFIL